MSGEGPAFREQDDAARAALLERVRPGKADVGTAERTAIAALDAATDEIEALREQRAGINARIKHLVADRDVLTRAVAVFERARTAPPALPFDTEETVGDDEPYPDDPEEPKYDTLHDEA